MDNLFSKEEILNKNTKLQQRINQLDNDLKLTEKRLKEQLDLVRREYEECIQKLKDQEIKSNLKIESLKTENKTIKSELVNMRSAKIESDQKLADSTQIVSDQTEELKKMNTNIANWNYKYKFLMEKTKKIEELESKITNQVNNVIDENKNLTLVNRHNKCLVEIIEEDNTKSIKDLNEKLSLKNHEIETLNKKITNLELNNDFLTKKNLDIEENTNKIKSQFEYITQQNRDLEDELLKINRLVASKTNLLIEQKNFNLNLENDLKEKAKNFERIKEERNSIMLELNETCIKYDIQIEELKNEVKKYEFKFKKECDDKERFEKLNLDLKEKLQINQTNLKELNNKNNKITYDNCTQTLASYKTKQVFTQTVPIYSENAQIQTDENDLKQFKTKPLGCSNIVDDLEEFPEIDFAISSNSKLDDSVAYKNKNVLYKTNANLSKFIRANEERNYPKKFLGYKPNQIGSSSDENSKKKVRFSETKFN